MLAVGAVGHEAKRRNEAWEGRNDAAEKQPKGKTLDMNPTGKKKFARCREEEKREGKEN